MCYSNLFCFYSGPFGLWSWIFPYFCLTGLAPRGGGPQHGAALVPDHPVAGAIALVPAPTPPDKPVVFFFFKSVSDQLDFLTSIPPGLEHRLNPRIVANMNTRLHVESLFYIYWCKLELLEMFCGWVVPKQPFAIFIMNRGSAQTTFCFKCDFFLSCIEFLDISKNKSSEIYVIWVHFIYLAKILWKMQKSEMWKSKHLWGRNLHKNAVNSCYQLNHPSRR